MNRNEIAALTGLRGLAALWVFLFHIPVAVPTASPALKAVLGTLGAGGYLGVDIFFVLSGFVLTLNYGEARLHRQRESNVLIAHHNVRHRVELLSRQS